MFFTKVKHCRCICCSVSDVMAREYHQTAVQCARDMEHPARWSRDDVSRWLKWCVVEYDLSSGLPDRFLMNGLCLSNRIVLHHEDSQTRGPDC